MSDTSDADICDKPTKFKSCRGKTIVAGRVQPGQGNKILNQRCSPKYGPRQATNVLRYEAHWMQVCRPMYCMNCAVSWRHVMLSAMNICKISTWTKAREAIPCIGLHHVRVWKIRGTTAHTILHENPVHPVYHLDQSMTMTMAIKTSTLVYPPIFTHVRNQRGVELPPGGFSSSTLDRNKIPAATPIFSGQAFQRCLCRPPPMTPSIGNPRWRPETCI